jgi:hypothetical protein
VAYFPTPNGRFPAPGVFVRTVRLNCLSESVPQNSKMIQNGGFSARTEGCFCPVELQGGNTNYRAQMRAINTVIGGIFGLGGREARDKRFCSQRVYSRL